MSQIRIGRKDYLWSYIGMFLRFGVNIILLPMVLRYLSDDELGLWYVFGSISALVALLDFGFVPAISRNISYVWSGAKKLMQKDVVITQDSNIDLELFKTVLYTCKYIYLILAFASLAILLTIGTWYIINISNTDAIPAWCVYSLGVFLNVLYSYYSSFLRGVGGIAESNIAVIISRLVQIVVTIPLLLLGYGLMGVSIAFLLSGIALRLYSKRAFYRYEKIGAQLKNVLVSDRAKKCCHFFKVIWYNASRDGFVTISNFLSTQANTLICSSLIGLSATGSYGISIQLASVIGTVSFVPFSTNQSLLQGKSVEGDLCSSKRIFATAMVSYIIVFVLLSVFLLLALPIIYRLKPNYSIDVWMLTTILLYYFMYNLYCMCASFISTFNEIPYMKSFVITSISSVLLSFICAKYLQIGIWALIISPVVVSVTYNLWKWPSYAIHNKLQCSYVSFVKEGIVGTLNYFK